MEFTIAHTQTLPFEGQYPSTVHLPTNEIMCFSSDGTNLMVAQSEIYPTANIDWSNVAWKEPVIATPDTGLTYIKLKSVPRVGFYGVWTQTGEERQRFAIYKGETDISNWIETGTISFDESTPTAQMNLTITNQRQLGVGEVESNINPGSKVTVSVTLGDDINEIPLGVFYVDSTSMNVRSKTSQVVARNISGKMLNDQFLGEGFSFSKKIFRDNIKELFTNASIPSFKVQELSLWEMGLTFTPDTTFMDALQEFNDLALWKTIETQEGEIISGDPNYMPELMIFGKYQFKRDDLYTLAVQRDDNDTYKRVCVHDKDFVNVLYLDLDLPLGWEAPPNKIYFHEVAENTGMEQITQIAERLRDLMNYGGTVETFTRPFAPQILAGDEAEIEDSNGTRVVGLITNVTHTIGMKGFSTSFTVDSGGRLGKPNMVSLIENVAKKATQGKGILVE